MKDVRFVDINSENLLLNDRHAELSPRLRKPWLWLSEFRKKEIVFCFGEECLNTVRNLVFCLGDGGKVVSVLRAEIIGDVVRVSESASPTPLPQDENLPAIEDAFMKKFSELNKEKRPDIIVLGRSVLTYRLLNEIRRELGRLGVIIVAAEQREAFLEKFHILKNFCQDMKIDYVMLSDRECAIFVWSWNVTLSFPQPYGVTTPEKQSLALSVIVKNESRFIENMIRSVAKIIEFAAVLDTGSTDGTGDIASKVLKDEDVASTIVKTEFLGFSEARNRCIGLVPTHVSWILMLDADEVIREADFESLFHLLYHPVHDAWALPRVNWESAHLNRCISYPDRQFRLFRNNGKIRYEGVVHERLVGYRSLGWPAPNVSFAGLVGGPHIHHMAKTLRTKTEQEEKIKWYLKIAESGTGSEDKEALTSTNVATAEGIFSSARTTGTKDAQGILLDLDSDGSTLVISCSGIVPNKVIYAMENSSRHIPTKRLFICDHKSLWYYQGIDGLTKSFNDTIDIVGELVKLIGPSRTCAIGTSGGGYMALALGARLGLDRVLALSPQTNISSAWRAQHNDGRWSSNMSTIHRHIRPLQPYDILDLIEEQSSRMFRGKTKFHVVYPAGDPLDVAHATRLIDLEGVEIYGLQDSEHNVSAELHRRGRLQPILETFIGSGEEDLNGKLRSLILA